MTETEIYDFIRNNPAKKIRSTTMINEYAQQYVLKIIENLADKSHNSFINRQGWRTMAFESAKDIALKEYENIGNKYYEYKNYKP